MNIADESQTLLVSAGFRVERYTENALYFEDEAILGFVVVHESPEAILQSWQQQQDDFLAAHASHLRAAGWKAWNAYSVFLTAASATEQQHFKLLSIEEDFRATRKIARAGLEDRLTLIDALAAVLPLTNIVRIEASDALTRLRSRLILDDSEWNALQTGNVETILSSQPRL